MKSVVCCALLWLSASLSGYFHFQEMQRHMSFEEREKAGLDKLTLEDRTNFENWLVRKKNRYHVSVPIVSQENKIEWVYETQKRKPYKKKYNPAIYDESKIPYNLAIFSLFQHEACYLQEWIEYHKLLGVDHFYLYNNLSNDHYLEVLLPYIASGTVTLVQWPYYDPDNAAPYYWCEMQLRAYENAMAKARGKYRWMAFIDTDEFIVPVKHNSLIDFLADYEQYGGVVINWMMYGTSNVPKIHPGELLIDKLLLRGPSKSKENENVKSIVKPHRVKFWPSPHWCEYKSGYYSVTPTQTRASSSQYNALCQIDAIRINHYWFRDAGFFWNVKVPRWRNTAWQMTNAEFKKREDAYNVIYDPIIKKYVKRLKKRLKRRAQISQTQKLYHFTVPTFCNEKDIQWMFQTRRIKKENATKKIYDESKMAYSLALYAVFYNKASKLRDWIEYHKMQGIEHFYLYNTLSTDEYIEVLQPYIESGEVELIQWPRLEISSEIFEHCLERAKGQAKWLLVLHPDEILVSQNESLPQLLKEHDNDASLEIMRLVIAPLKIREQFEKKVCALYQPHRRDTLIDLRGELKNVRIDCYRLQPEKG